MGCPRCDSSNVLKNGILNKGGSPKQRYRCKDCKKEWVGNTDTLNVINKEISSDIISDYGKDSATVTTKSLNIKTLDDALKASNVDLNLWEVDRHIINSWEVTCVIKKDGGGVPETFTNYQVKVFLKRKIKSNIENSIENIIKGIKPCNYTPIKFENVNKPHLLEISLYDHHFGKLAWNKETGTNYDLKIASSIFKVAVEDLIKKSVGYSIDKIVFPIGNDFFHINDQTNETPGAHHRLDTDGRMAKVFETGLQSCIHAIERCLTVAPTQVLWVPGNHDPHMSYYLCKILQAYFKNQNDFFIDVSEKCRKYINYGSTIIGYTHGSEEPASTLPLLMATEMKKHWNTSKYFEWHIGHTHKKKEMRFVSADSYGPVKVISIPSLTATDYWHYKKGYVGGNRAAEAYLYDKNNGFVAQFVHNIE